MGLACLASESWSLRLGHTLLFWDPAVKQRDYLEWIKLRQFLSTASWNNRATSNSQWYLGVTCSRTSWDFIQVGQVGFSGKIKIIADLKKTTRNQNHTVQTVNSIPNWSWVTHPHTKPQSEVERSLLATRKRNMTCESRLHWMCHGREIVYDVI